VRLRPPAKARNIRARCHDAYHRPGHRAVAAPRAGTDAGRGSARPPYGPFDLPTWDLRHCLGSRKARTLAAVGTSTAEGRISEERCWALLATASVGRLALSVHALPAIYPVHYYLDGRQIVACVGHHQIPQRSLENAVVAFAADAIDPASRSGWAVHVLGRSTLPRQPGPDAGCGQPGAGQVVNIEPDSITGHAVHPCPLIDALRAAGPGFP
jgi:hypothetical protein